MRKGKPQLQRIDIDELFSNSSNRGMLSFLERPPEEAQTRLREKQKVDEADSRRIAPVGELPPARMSPPANPEAAPPIPFSAQCKGRSAANGLDQPEGILPLLVSYPLVKSPAGDISPSPTGCEVNSLSPTGELLPGVGSREISPDFRLRFESYGGAIRPQGQLPTGSHLKTIIDGSVVGRRQKIRRAAVAQDGHSSGEQLLYQSLWNAAAVETPETRLLSVGYNGMSTLCKLDKSNCKKNIQSLIEKLAVQVAETYKSASSTGTTYRIFSYREILRRR